MNCVNDLLQQYHADLQEQKKEASTIKIYLLEIEHFLNWFLSRKKSLLDVDQTDLICYRDRMLERRMKISSINKSISILSSFFKWATKKGYAPCNYAERIRLWDGNKPETPRWLSLQEEQLLLQCASEEKNPFKKARNEALIYVMLYAGLRVEEVSELLLDSFTEKEELVVFDEGREKRRVPVTPNVKEKLSLWLVQRNNTRKEIHRNSPYLFVTERSGKMQPRAVQFVIENYSERLGLPITCQMLRHTYCRRLAEQELPLEMIQKLAGHKSILTTYQYVFDLVKTE
jgi:site-specific recombinase XerD